MLVADWEDLQTLKWAQTVDPHQSEECELLLETYSMQVRPHLSPLPSAPCPQLPLHTLPTLPLACPPLAIA